MKSRTDLRQFDAVIVAAGQGLRAGQALPKQFATWRGKMVLRHSLEGLKNCGAARIVIAIPEGGEELAQEAAEGLSGVKLVTGGATRQLSVLAGLEALVAGNGSVPHAPLPNVLIHDAARPIIVGDVIDRLLDALQHHSGAIPVLPVVDSLAGVAQGGLMQSAPNRAQLRRVQTPQAFHFDAIFAAHRALSQKGTDNAGDDAQVLHAAGHEVALVDGDEALKKLTFAEDFMDQNQAGSFPIMRSGMGFDVHRLSPGEDLWLCGIEVPHDKGLAGHSDADVALHALVDALLGALGKGDIGTYFPPSEAQWRGAASSVFVEHAVKQVASAGYGIANVDVTIICEAPKIGPHRDAMTSRVAELLSIDKSCVNIKATTTERLGLTGRGEGIAAQAIALLSRAA